MHNIYLKNTPPLLRDETISKEADAPHPQDEDEKSLFCKVCSNIVTTEKMRINRQGKHEHAFFNPHGIVFEIGCFSQAKGCSIHGNPNYDFSWFKDYSWRFAECRNCGSHLGWFYEKIESSFFGLILTMLTE